MSYSFQPLSEEELDAFEVLPKGTYHFKVITSTARISKSGNPMAELRLNVYKPDGGVYVIYDYLVFSTVNLNIKKVAHFAKATGLYEEYKKGHLPEDLNGKTGKVEIDVEDGKAKPNGGFYPKKNVVLNYVAKTENDEPVPDFIDDVIPF